MKPASTPTPRARPIVPVVVAQHAEESAALRRVRSVLVRAPHVKLHQLQRLDDRIAAHLDGLVVAGADGRRLAEMALESPGAGEVFAVAVLQILAGDTAALAKTFALAQAHPPALAGLLSAFGWMSREDLRGLVATLLTSRSAFARQVGLAACAMHRVDPGPALAAAVGDADNPDLRAKALRVAGGMGRRDLLDPCLAALSDADARCRLQAALAAVRLGDRRTALRALQQAALLPSPEQTEALCLLLSVTPIAQSRAVLETLAEDGKQMRALIRGVGLAGDAHYVPWLIERMADPKLTRLAGESFSLITGLDLAWLDLEVKPPENFPVGPSDDPADDDVAMDEDDSLPWPDVVKIASWWSANGKRFAAGVRYFMGEPPSRGHCERVLREGFQRQRIVAAQHLALLQLDAPIFPTASPAWRQQRLLEQMTG